MKKLKKIVLYLSQPWKIVLSLSARSHFGFRLPMNDKAYLKLLYWDKFRKRMDFNNPQTFNEKLQWLKIYDRNPNYIKLVDKYEAKYAVGTIIGNEYIIPTLGVWDKFDDIDFQQLPDNFVLKCTHDSGGLVIVKDKKTLDKRKAKKTIEKSLNRNYYYPGREWPYKNILPRIIAEKYMCPPNSQELNDYKFLCFNGKCEMCFTCTERYSSNDVKVTFFDLDWNELPFERYHRKSSVPIPKPIKLKEMIELSEKLAKGINFVRVDFYEIENKIYFGEMTFYPGSGLEPFQPNIWDLNLGKKIILNKKD